MVNAERMMDEFVAQIRQTAEDSSGDTLPRTSAALPPVEGVGWKDPTLHTDQGTSRVGVMAEETPMQKQARVPIAGVLAMADWRALIGWSDGQEGSLEVPGSTGLEAPSERSVEGHTEGASVARVGPALNTPFESGGAGTEPHASISDAASRLSSEDALGSEETSSTPAVGRVEMATPTTSLDEAWGSPSEDSPGWEDDSFLAAAAAALDDDRGAPSTAKPPETDDSSPWEAGWGVTEAEPEQEAWRAKTPPTADLWSTDSSQPEAPDRQTSGGWTKDVRSPEVPASASVSAPSARASTAVPPARASSSAPETRASSAPSTARTSTAAPSARASTSPSTARGATPTREGRAHNPPGAENRGRHSSSRRTQPFRPNHAAGTMVVRPAAPLVKSVPNEPHARIRYFYRLGRRRLAYKLLQTLGDAMPQEIGRTFVRNYWKELEVSGGAEGAASGEKGFPGRHPDAVPRLEPEALTRSDLRLSPTEAFALSRIGGGIPMQSLLDTLMGLEEEAFYQLVERLWWLDLIHFDE